MDSVIEVALPATPEHEVELLAEPRLGASPPDARLADRLTISEPVIHRLTPTEVDEQSDGRPSAASAAPGSEYCLLSFVCTFRPPPNPADHVPFSDAAVGLLLESPGAPAESQPIAWSISPKERPTAGGSRQTKLGLTAKLAIVQPSFEYTKQDQEREFKVVGMGEQHRDPEWRFHTADGRELYGDERISVVIRMSAGQPVRATLRVSATVRQRRLGLVPYRAVLPVQVRQIDLR
ncbi:hypothetical protein [Streptomyces sp. NPDC001635]